MRARAIIVVCLAVAGCEAEPGAIHPVVFGGDRPARLWTPPDYAPERPAPLIVALHGFGGQGSEILAFTGLDRLVEEQYAMVVAPDGVADSQGRRTWNGTDACCDVEGRGTDDVGYLVDLVDEAARSWAIDRDRVFVLGFSAGGFMAYRAACDRADRFTGAISIAGASFLDPDDCAPERPVHVLQVHGDQDRAIAYAGDATHPGARGSTNRWAGYNGCGPLSAEVGRLDLDREIEGDETRLEAYPSCPPRGSVELWTLEGSDHQPAIRERFRAPLWGWIESR